MHFHPSAAGRWRWNPGEIQAEILRISWVATLGRSTYEHCVVTEEQIQKWAEEAEAGYDVEELKRRGRGRPGRGAEPMQVVAVRLTAEELEALDAAASRHHMSRSQAIRAALARFTA